MIFIEYILIIGLLVALILSTVRISTWVPKVLSHSKGPRFFNKSMVELKHCPRCNKDLPKTEEFFFLNKKKGWWCTYCRPCDSKRVSEKNSRKYQKKLSLPSPKEILAAREAQEQQKASTPLRTCSWCGETLPLDKNYFYWITKKERFEPMCLECRQESNRKRMSIRRFGEDLTCENPGEFNSDEERQEVHDMLTLMGWKYSENFKQWYRPGLKTKTGRWIFQKRIR